ncbi:50S ribosomal protein L18 [Desulfococcaceae bacterium HSG7]|nr:50S ribosomal protein L18 [Desulfococcaceae bacterium HSG9]MDM8553788.1 50S ribosomal protein L18 [Desulfococcaceae bacterium HSG7]
MKIQNKKRAAQLKRKARIRKKVSGNPERLRLTVFRSSKHIYAQVIDDTIAHTVASTSSLENVVADQLAQLGQDSKKDHTSSGKIGQAKMVGKIVAQRALEKGVKRVVFDRNGFLYHGRVKAVSEGAREAGLVF